MEAGIFAKRYRISWVLISLLVLLMSVLVHTSFAYGLEPTTPVSGVISGTVVDQANNPASGVAIVIQASDNSINRVTTNNNGQYSLANLPLGQYKLCALVPDSYGGAAVKQWYNNTLSEDQAALITLDTTNNSVVINLKVDTTLTKGCITGRVTDNEGTPMAGVSVKAEIDYGNDSNFAVTDTNGNYKIGGLVEGYYKVNVIAAGGWSSSQQYAYVEDYKTVSNINFTLQAGGSIAGNVVDENGNRVWGKAKVVCKSTDGKQYETVTAYDGSYNINGLPMGTYKVGILHAGDYEVTDKGYVPPEGLWLERYNWGDYWLPTWYGDPITLSSNMANAADIKLMVKKGRVLYGNISGLDAANLPAAGYFKFKVTATERNTGVSNSVIFDPRMTGMTYAVPGLPAGSYWVKLKVLIPSETGYKTVGKIERDTLVQVKSDEEYSGPYEISIPFWGHIEGCVKDSQGNYLSDIKVFAANVAGTDSYSGTTDSDGHYYMMLPVGNYAVSAGGIDGGSDDNYLYAHQWYNQANSKEKANIVSIDGVNTEVKDIDFTLQPVSLIQIPDRNSYELKMTSGYEGSTAGYQVVDSSWELRVKVPGIPAARYFELYNVPTGTIEQNLVGSRTLIDNALTLNEIFPTPFWRIKFYDSLTAVKPIADAYVADSDSGSVTEQSGTLDVDYDIDPSVTEVADNSLIIGKDVYQLNDTRNYTFDNVLASIRYGGNNILFKNQGRWYDLIKGSIKSVADLFNAGLAVDQTTVNTWSLRNWYQSGYNHSQFGVPGQVTSIYAGLLAGVSTNGFTIGLQPAVKGLTKANFALADKNGLPIDFTVTEVNSGSKYQINALLTLNESYTLTISKGGYNFGSPLKVNVTTVNALSVTTNYTAAMNGIRMSFNVSDPGLNPDMISVKLSNGYSLWDYNWDGKQAYEYEYTWPVGYFLDAKFVTITINKPGYAPIKQTVLLPVKAPAIASIYLKDYPYSLRLGDQNTAFDVIYEVRDANGNRVNVAPKDLIWHSSNPALVSVINGHVMPAADPNPTLPDDSYALITAQTPNGAVSNQLSVNISDAAAMLQKVIVSPIMDSDISKPGIQLTLDAQPGGRASIKLLSVDQYGKLAQVTNLSHLNHDFWPYDEKIARVNVDGIITAYGAGETRIQCWVADYCEEMIDLTVTQQAVNNVVPVLTVPVTNIIATDGGIMYGNKVIKIQFSPVAAVDNNKVLEYRILVVKEAEAAEFNLQKAQSVYGESCFHVDKGWQNDQQNCTVFSENWLRDTDGDAITPGVAYRVFILSVADGVNSTVDVLAGPSGSVSLGTAGSDSFEDDNVVANAKLITADGIKQTHSWYPAGDVDWLKFQAYAGNSYNVQVNSISYVYPYIDLHTTDGVFLVGSNSTGNSASLQWTAPSDGIYYLQVRSNGTQTSSYDISVSEARLVTRTAGSITQDPGYTGGTGLVYNNTDNPFALSITGGPVAYYTTASGVPYDGNWIGVAIKVPNGFTGDVKSLIIDGQTKNPPYMSDAEKQRGELWIYLKVLSSNETHSISIVWADQWLPENIVVNLTNVSLAIPVTPTSITDNAPVFQAGVTREFSLSGNSGINCGKLVNLRFTIPQGATIESTVAGVWTPIISGTLFGPSEGTPLTAALNFPLRATFSTAGSYQITVGVVEVGTNNVLATHVIQAQVNEPTPMTVSDNVSADFRAGVVQEFDITTVANKDQGKSAKVHFTIPQGTYVEYYNGTWNPLPADFGPVIVSDASYLMRATFSQTGPINLQADFIDTADNTTVLASHTINFQVDPNPMQLTVNFISQPVVNVNTEFTVNTAAYCDLGKTAMINFQIPDGVTIQYLNNGIWQTVTGAIGPIIVADTSYQFNVLCSQPGIYYLGIEFVDENNNILQHKTVQVIPVGTTNNSASAALLLDTFGSPSLQNISTVGDVDWFKCNGIAGTTYTIETSQLSNLDTEMFLYTADGVTQISYCDDADGLGLGSRIVYTPGAAGLFYIKVQDLGNDASGTYFLTFTATPPQP